MRATYVILGLIILSMTSCNTYYMTSNSLKQQMQKVDPNKISDAYDFRLGLLGVALKGGKNFYNGMKPLTGEDIADLIYYCASLPQHVCINDVVITPTQQADANHKL